MSVQYVHTKPGYRFKITFVGRRIKSVAAKYDEDSYLYKQYKHNAPKTWLTNGYIEQVKESEEDYGNET